MMRGTVRIEKDNFVIAAPPHIIIKLRRVFQGAQRTRTAGTFTISATPGVAHELEWFRQRHPLDFVDGSENRHHKLVKAEERRLESLAEMDAPDYVPREFGVSIPPREYQKVAAELALRTRNLLIADDLGLGKTLEAILTLTAKGSLPAVIVTMTHLPRQWERELARFIPRLRVHRIKSGKPYAWTSIRHETTYAGVRRAVVPGVPDVVIINYHKLDKWAETLAKSFRTVIFDEVQELRISDSDKYRAAAAIASVCDLRIGLSATPIYNYGGEIFSVVDALAPGALGTWEEFRGEWCGGGGFGDPRKVQVADPAALGTYLREAGLMIRRTRKDVGRELPALTVVRHVVEVNADRIKEAVAEVAELAERVLARTGTNFERMQWSGEIDYRMRQATGIAKAPAVVDFVRLLIESGERVVLYGWHHDVYALYREGLLKHGHTFAMYTGDEDEVEKVASVKAFTDGEAQVLIISLRAGAGLDGLQHVSRAVVFGELDWSPKVHEQDIGRVHRDGQLEQCLAYYCVAEEGSDPVIADVLGVKEAQSNGIINPDDVGTPMLVGASEPHIRKLAEDVLRRMGKPIPKRPPEAEQLERAPAVDKPVEQPAQGSLLDLMER